MSMILTPIRRSALAAAHALVLLGAACSRGPSEGGGGPGGPPGGGMPPMPVEVVTLAEAPVEHATESIGTVKSRRSATVQPQVEGFITRIAARSGDRVAPGALLMEIDSGRQQAAVANLEAQRKAREADLDYWKQQSARLRTLLDAGAVSQQEYDQAQATVRTGEAQVAAIDQQIREQQVELGYHRVVAPASGVLGDIPVRTGDRVTQSTVLTTIDDNQAMEVYLQVPVQQAPELTVGLPVRLVDEQGQTILTTAITFVAPSVDPATQSVLAKAALERPGTFRNDQFVRARVVWNSAPGLTVPLVAVSRINGRFFVFIADKGDKGEVAHQRAVEVGPMSGNDYLITSGLKAGERLIVSGVQKIGDGAPIMARPAGTPAPAAAPPGGAPAEKKS